MLRSRSIGMRICLMILLALLLSSIPASGQPQVVGKSTPVGPNETVLLVGEGLDKGCKVEMARLADAPSAAPAVGPASWPAGARVCEAIQPSGQSVKAIVPADLAMGVFACRLSNDFGHAIVLLNAPEVWWLQGDGGTTASPGGWLRILGKCLAVPQKTATVLLTGPATLRLPASGDGYSLRAALPADLKAGAYALRVHNGCGGDDAWSGPLALQITAAHQWPAMKLDVREMGAVGDGTVDDTASIRAGLARLAANGGGVLYFPR